MFHLGMVVHACNLSYTGRIGRKIMVQGNWTKKKKKRLGVRLKR
jgi:hypothetical protein